MPEPTELEMMERAFEIWEGCVEIDRSISLLKKMMEQWASSETIKAANDLIKIMEAEKARYHPE